MQIQPYLFFEGRCDEALEFYRTTLGAQVTALMRYSDSPEPHPPGMLPPGSDNKVMHCNFTVGESQVMFGTDWPHQVHDVKGAFANTARLPAAQMAAVRSANAQRLFKL